MGAAAVALHVLTHCNGVCLAGAQRLDRCALGIPDHELGDTAQGDQLIDRMSTVLLECFVHLLHPYCQQGRLCSARRMLECCAHRASSYFSFLETPATRRDLQLYYGYLDSRISFRGAMQVLLGCWMRVAGGCGLLSPP